MKHDANITALPRLGHHSVTVLPCKAELRLNPEPLVQIFAEKGEDVAEETVSRALEDLARRINQLQPHRLDGSFDKLVRPVQRIGVIAEQIGLVEVASAAENVAGAARQNDGIAVEATLCRLERAFDTAVSQAWSFHSLI